MRQFKNAVWEYDPIMRGWRVVATDAQFKYQSAALYTHNDQLFASTLFRMQHAELNEWRSSGVNTFTLPASV